MEATMQLAARPVQLAVMSTPTSNLAEALAAARQRASVTSLVRRILGGGTGTPDRDADERDGG